MLTDSERLSADPQFLIPVNAAAVFLILEFKEPILMKADDSETGRTIKRWLSCNK